MAVKENDWNTFDSYFNKAKQLFAEGKKIPKEMLTYKWSRSGWIVAHWLAVYSNKPPHWQTDDKEILVLRENDNDTVAHKLALWHPTWVTNDPEILHLKNDENITVKEILIEQIMAGEKHGS